MYTETELRDMLKASADRVPAADTGASNLPGHARIDVLEPTQLDTDRPRRSSRKIVAPLAVAAVTIVVAGVVTLATQQGNDTHEPPAAGSDSPTASAPTTSSAPARSRAHQATTPIIDVVTVQTTNSTDNYVGPVGEDNHGQQVITSQLPHDRAINLVVASATAFDDVHVSRSHPVAIAGTTGHYDVLKLFPLSANGKGGSAPTGTIVFRTPDRHWAFAWLQKGVKKGTAQGTPVDDPAAIVKAYDTLNATFASGRYRTPLRLNYLPVNARFVAADQTTSSAPGVQYPSLTATDGDRQMDVTLYSAADKPDLDTSTDGQNCHFKILKMCTTEYHRNLPGGGQVQVQGIGYSTVETEKVLDGVVVAADVTDRSTYFTLPDAIG